MCLQVKEDESQEAVQIQTMLSTVGMIQTLALFWLEEEAISVRAEKWQIYPGF